MPNRIIRESIRESYSIDDLSPQAEVLFYRLITYADDYGLFKCDPRLVNKALFPLKGYLEDEIKQWLDEISATNMINFYVGNNGKPYGFFTNWSQYQTTRNNKPKHPAPEKDCELLQSIDALLNSIDFNCKQTKTNAPLIQSNPIQSESNPNKALFTNVNKAPVSGGHFSTQIDNYAEPIINTCKKILKLPQKNGKRFNPFQWVQSQTNSNMHPGAILETIEALANPQYWKDIRDGPWAYATAIIKTKNGNWNERSHITEAEKFKTIWISPEVKKLIQNIGSKNESS